MGHQSINKIGMQHFLKNGQYFQRKKLFLHDPFHNMKSHISLDWQAQECTTQELQRARQKQSQQHQNLIKIYNQQVDQRLQHRFGNMSTIQRDFSKSRDTDILSKELQIFNQSKTISAEPGKGKQDLSQSRVQPPPLELREQGEYAGKFLGGVLSEPKENYHLLQNSKSAKGNQSYQEHLNQNREFNASEALRSRLDSYDQKDYDTLQSQQTPQTRGRYQSSQKRSPYQKDDLGRLMSELYPRGKLEQYPLRSVVPDRFESHLRDRSKPDKNKKPKYQVTLNLLKR